MEVLISTLNPTEVVGNAKQICDFATNANNSVFG